MTLNLQGSSYFSLLNAGFIVEDHQAGFVFLQIAYAVHTRWKFGREDGNSFFYKKPPMVNVRT